MISICCTVILGFHNFHRLLSPVILNPRLGTWIFIASNAEMKAYTSYECVRFYLCIKLWHNNWHIWIYLEHIQKGQLLKHGFESHFCSSIWFLIRIQRLKGRQPYDLEVPGILAGIKSAKNRSANHRLYCWPSHHLEPSESLQGEF